MNVVLYSKNQNRSFLIKAKQALEELLATTTKQEFLERLSENSDDIVGIKENEFLLDAVRYESHDFLLSICSDNLTQIEDRIGYLDYTEGRVSLYSLAYMKRYKDTSGEDSTEYLTYLILLTPPKK